MIRAPVSSLARPAPPIRVLLVNEREAALRDLGALIGRDARMTVAGTARSIADALNAIWVHRPHVVVLDLSVGRVSSLDYLHDLLGVRPVEVVFFTGARDPERYRRAIERGAFAIVPREKPDDLLRAIQRAHASHEAPLVGLPARWADDRFRAAGVH